MNNTFYMLSGVPYTFIIRIDFFSGLIRSSVRAGMAGTAVSSADDADTVMRTGHAITSYQMPMIRTSLPQACSRCWECESQHREQAFVRSEDELSPQAEQPEWLRANQPKLPAIPY